MAAAVICLASTQAGAQPATSELVVTAGSGTFRMPPLASLVNETAVVGAERAAERALRALGDAALAGIKEIEKLDAEISVNAASMEEANKVLAKKRLELQPTIDAYTSDQAALRADDDQLVKDQAPVRELIETYNRTPANERTAEQYDRIVALKTPFDSRLEALKARKDTLKARFDSIEEELTAQEQPLAGMRKLDLALLARRKMETGGLGDAYRQLRTVYEYSTQIGAQLGEGKRKPSPTLARLLESTDDVLKTLSERGFDAAKNPATAEAPPR